MCKAEWAYEVAYVFDSLDNFQAFMGSDFFAKYTVLQDRAMEGFAVDPEKVYNGNRVLDEWDA